MSNENYKLLAIFLFGVVIGYAGIASLAMLVVGFLVGIWGAAAYSDLRRNKS